MQVEKIELSQFRNIDRLALTFSPGVNVFVGANGQGKTNILESLYFLSVGGSFRPGKNDSFIKKGGDGVAKLKARLFKNELHFDLALTLDMQKKLFVSNAKKVNATFLRQKFPCVLFSPESLSAIKDGPEQRRQLVDEFLPSHDIANAKLIAEFKRCLRARNRLLKDQKNGKIAKSEALAVLHGIDVNYLRLARDLTRARLSALNDLAEEFIAAMRFISNQDFVDISVDYLISSEPAWGWQGEKIDAALQNRMIELRSAEIEAGVTLVGPQKHDIRFLFAGEDSRYYCSQGQQRALILSFKIAQIMYHYRAYQDYPFLLLDDVLSELDLEKRSKLIEFLRGIKAQIFLTTTDFSCPAEFSGQRWLSVFNVERGRIEIAS